MVDGQVSLRRVNKGLLDTGRMLQRHVFLPSVFFQRIDLLLSSKEASSRLQVISHMLDKLREICCWLERIFERPRFGLCVLRTMRLTCSTALNATPYSVAIKERWKASKADGGSHKYR